MPNISISAKSVMNIDPHADRRISVELELTDAQVMEAVETLVENMSSAQRFELLIGLEAMPS